MAVANIVAAATFSPARYVLFDKCRHRYELREKVNEVGRPFFSRPRGEKE